jgi:hypothetical protein
MLSVMKHMILFGLVRKLDDLNQIFASLYPMLLKAKNSVSRHRVEACIELCQILDIIKDIQLDRVITGYLQKFKEGYEMGKLG